MATKASIPPHDPFSSSKIGHGLPILPPLLEAEMPTKWPMKLKGDLVWTGSQFTSEQDFTLFLTEEDKAEVKAAVEHFKGLGLDGSKVERATFPLPSLKDKLYALAHDVHNGRGFVNIRGLDPKAYNAEDNMLAFLGVSSYIGNKRARQDPEGNMIGMLIDLLEVANAVGHLFDAPEVTTPQKDRPIRYSNRGSHFHTDMFCDILAFQTRSAASEGGNHTLASAWQVYNEIAATHPEWIPVMADGNWPFDSRQRLFQSGLRPLIFYKDKRLIMNFTPRSLKGVDGLPRPEGLPSLNDHQLEILNKIEEIAVRNQVSLRLLPGDLTFVNNHGLLHARAAFKDDENSKRYLVRLWLKNESLAWKLPRPLKHGNVKIYEGDGLDEKWNILPVPKVVFALSDRLSY